MVQSGLSYAQFESCFIPYSNKLFCQLLKKTEVDFLKIRIAELGMVARSPKLFLKNPPKSYKKSLQKLNKILCV